MTHSSFEAHERRLTHPKWLWDVGEVGSNIAGGYGSHTTARYVDQFTFGANLDLQKIAGWNDAEFNLIITERTGRDITNEGMSDPRVGGLSSVMEVYGLPTWRLTQMWYPQGFYNGVLDFKVGRMGIGEDFGDFPCVFQSLALCGSQFGTWATDTVYNWPVSQWGVRMKVAVADNLFAQVGVYEQNPTYLETGNSFKLFGHGNESTLLPVELVYRPVIGEQKFPGEYRIGAYYSSRNAADVKTLEGGEPKTRDGRYGGGGG